LRRSKQLGGFALKTYLEPARETPIAYEPDVIICGGGVTGCSAAIAAARCGAKVLLAERNGVLGGVATAGLMANITNMFMTSRDVPVVKGIPKEIVERLVAEGGTRPNWHRAELPGIVIDPEIFKLVLSEMLMEAGVEILLHTITVGAIMEDKRIRGVMFENKSGRQAALASNVIDATGDADVVHFSGAPYHVDKADGSMEFRLANVDLDRAVDYFGEYRDTFPENMDYVRDYDSFRRNWYEYGFLFFPHGGGRKFGPWKEAVERGEYKIECDGWYGLNAFGMYALRGDNTVVVNSNFHHVAGVDVREFTRVEIEARRMCHYAADFLRKHLPGFENAHVIATAEDWGQRVTRYIMGRQTLTQEEAKAGRKWDEVIGRAPFKEPDEPTYGFEIPYGIMVPKEIDGLLAPSGKMVSTQPRGMIRGMSFCMTLGQAAGVAAALGSVNQVPAGDVPIHDIQRKLLEQGAYLGEPDRLHELGLV